MNEVNLKINDQEVTVDENATILDAAEKVGIEIPTLCFHPEISCDGSCRVCVVEDENSGDLVTACCNPVVEDMEIRTDSKKAEKARKMNLELLLANHPNECMTCEADGSCELQDLAYQFGIDEPQFPNIKEEKEKIENANPFIEFDPNKCILCGRCVRACDEIQASHALEFSQRGYDTKIFSNFDEKIDDDFSACVKCGQCVEICPTGALSYIPSKNKARAYDFDKKVETTCPYCGVGCQLELKIKDNKVVEVGSIYDSDHPNSKGETCVKGRFAYQFIQSPDRLTEPMIKKEGHFEKCSWEEALNKIAAEFSQIKEKKGGEAIAGLTSARCTNEENYLMQKFMRAAVGSNHIDHCAHL